MNTTNLSSSDQQLSTTQQVTRRFSWVILTAFLLISYLLLNFVLPNTRSGNLNLFVFQPVLWILTAILTLWLWKMEGERLNLLEHRSLIGFAAIIGGLQVAISIIAGFMSGFGKSPYSHTLVMILLNSWFVITRLIGIETARWYLGKTIGRINSGWGYLIAWLLPFILLTPVSRFTVLTQPESAFRVIGGTFIPTAAENLLAAYLAVSAGPVASMIYLGVIQAFEWLSPVLPDLPWLVSAFIGVLIPVVGLIMLTREEAVPSDDSNPTKTEEQGKDRTSLGSWLIVALLATGVIWLNSGALGVRPSLISGNSMNPVLYPGDVVITKTITPESVQVGDVIQFQHDGVDVVHRVLAVQNTDSTLVFITRGDNNNVDDAPVMAEQLEGKVVLTIPKIGWIGLLFRQAIAWIGGAP
jgi:signal peptidase I